MGGHGGLNILPQKRWNVYNFDNREKVRKDEEAAAREESIRLQQQRQKDSEARLARLRDAALAKHGGIIDNPSGPTPDNAEETLNEGEFTHASQTDDIQHMKLFDGLISFKRLAPGSVASETCKGPQEVDKKIFRGDKELERLYKRATKEATRVGKDGVEADDEHYRLGYGCLDRKRKRPWYLLKSWMHEETESVSTGHSGTSQKKQKKTIEELREERLKREQQERERAQKIVSACHKGESNGLGRSTNRGHRPYYNSTFGNAR